VAGVFADCSARVAVADGIWPAIAMARRGAAVPVSSGLSSSSDRSDRASRTHPRVLAKQTSRTLKLTSQVPLPLPSSSRVTPPGENRRALSALPIDVLELPPPVMARLAALGLARLGAVADLPTESLTARFGTMGERAVKLARGLDPTPLVAHVPEEHPKETVELEGGVEALEPLVFLVKGLADRLAARLAGRVEGATQLSLVVLEESRAETLVPIILSTPSALVSAWMPVLKEMVAALRLPTPIVRLSLIARQVTRLAAEQLALDEHPERTLALETVLSRLESRLGPESVLVATLADSHRPEAAFSLQRYSGKKVAPVDGPQAERRSGGLRPTEPKARSERSERSQTDAHRPARLLSRPARIDIDARWTTARVNGTTHAIEWAEGPERLGGEWWASAYQRDYHRLRLRGLGDAWVYLSGGRAQIHGWFD